MEKPSKFKSTRIANFGLSRAERWLLEAKDAQIAKRYDNAVYCSQMCVEQAAKAILIALGIEYPREHDVSEEFRTLSTRIGVPEWFKRKLDHLSDGISELAKLRGLAGYGFEKGMTPEYFEEYSQTALGTAEHFLSSCKRLFKEIVRT
ncbi:MAG: HEPN domain-containing protein [Candidatus Bathyarchaeia archaeon]